MRQYFNQLCLFIWTSRWCIVTWFDQTWCSRNCWHRFCANRRHSLSLSTWSHQYAIFVYSWFTTIPTEFSCLCLFLKFWALNDVLILQWYLFCIYSQRNTIQPSVVSFQVFFFFGFGMLVLLYKWWNHDIYHRFLQECPAKILHNDVFPLNLRTFVQLLGPKPGKSCNRFGIWVWWNTKINTYILILRVIFVFRPSYVIIKYHFSK